MNPDASPNFSLTIYIDGHCQMCTRLGRFIEKHDRKGRIRVLDIRRDTHPAVDMAKARKKLASVDHEGNVAYGFESIYRISRTLPFFRLALPVLSVLKITRLGEWLYNELASKRNIIPLHCAEDCER